MAKTVKQITEDVCQEVAQRAIQLPGGKNLKLAILRFTEENLGQLLEL